MTLRKSGKRPRTPQEKYQGNQIPQDALAFSQDRVSPSLQLGDSLGGMENAKDLVSGGDHPRTFQEVDEWFRGDAACREYIRRLH